MKPGPAERAMQPTDESTSMGPPRDLPRSSSPTVGIQATSGQESPYKRVTEPMGKRHRGGLHYNHLQCPDPVIFDTGLERGRSLGWVGSLCRACRHNHSQAIQSSSRSHSSKRPFAYGSVMVNIGYFGGAALRRSQGTRLPECENVTERPARFRSSIVRLVASALCVTDCSAFPAVITCGWGIGYQLTGKVKRRRHRAECRFGLNKRCRSTAFDGGPTRFAEKGKTR
jgi:hypothetical protein